MSLRELMIFLSERPQIRALALRPKDCSSFRQLWVCRLMPAILMRKKQAQLEQAQLEQAQLEQCAGSTPLSCASAYPEAPGVLSDRIRRPARRGRQASKGAQFSWREYTACRGGAV
jgi:hypothetical protein